MRILIDSGADVNLRSQHEGSTPLHTATAAKKIGAVNFLLRHGADVEGQDKERNTALHVAAANGFLPITKILRAAKADISVQNLDGETPLDVAVRCGHVSMVRYLLEESLASNLNPLFSSSLLETAIKSEHQEIVKLVLGSFPRSELGTSGWRKSQAIFAAACAGKKEVLHLLTSNGFDVDEKNELNETPLQTAASSGNVHAVQLLLASGASIDLASARGTALCYAASAGDAEIVSYLLSKGAVVDLNTMRAAADKPTILSLLQWRDPERSGSAEKGTS
jgi:ankyrin repeat protein